MIHCKKTIIATCFSLLLPITGWAQAPVVDDSDNFAMYDGQEGAQASAARPQFDEAEFDKKFNESYQAHSGEMDDGAALVKDDPRSESLNELNDNAKLIDKIQKLQQEVQELRGQIEVQAHDLKLLQQQQLAFYKDLDARLGGGANARTSQAKPALDLDAKPSKVAVLVPSKTIPTKVVKPALKLPVSDPVSRINPADEQISYLAAYELVKNKRFDDAIPAMQTFAQKYPKGGYTANAEYWLGELYLVKKDYPQAIEHFEIVLKQFPSSSKSAASMLKAGYAFAASGDNEEAARRFRQVIKTYPGTPTAQLASTKLETI